MGRIAVVALITVILSLPAMFIYIHIAFGPLKDSLLLCYSLIFLLGIVSLLVIKFTRNKLKCVRYAFWVVFLSIPFLLVTVQGIHVNRGRAEQKKTGDGRSITFAIVEYAKDHNDYLPDANQWCDLLIEHHKNFQKIDSNMIL
jgi:hypothetical protein